jgi:hypothetical protein
MRPEVQQFVKGCVKCQTEKLVRVKTRLPMIISDTSLHAFEKISIDFYGPLNTTPEGYKYILTIQDYLSKYCILVTVKHANAEEVAKGLTEKMICYFGPPAAHLIDQGTHFQNKLFDEFAKLFGINKYCITAYHPQSNNSIERMHHTLAEYLRKYVENKSEWNTWVPICQHAYKCTIDEASSYSSHELVFSKSPRTPTSLPNKNQYTAYGEYITELIENLGQVLIWAALNIVQAKYRSKFYYDKKLNTQHFRGGEIVYALKEPRKGKLDMYYVGPYEIISIDYAKNNVVIQRDNKTKTLHIDKIKKAPTLKSILEGIT